MKLNIPVKRAFKHRVEGFGTLDVLLPDQKGSAGPFSECVLDVMHADAGSVSEDADHVEAQRIVVWSSGVEEVFCDGAQGVLLAGVTASSGSPKPVPRRSFTSTKARVSSLRTIRSISPRRVL